MVIPTSYSATMPSRFPAANISRLNDTVATDTFFSDIAANDDGIMGHGGTPML
jgi:hypothetical protein